MGMGGGTFLVPLLAVCFGVEQVFCQSTNVLCFLTLAIVCFVIYVIRKMIDFKVMFLVGLPASIVAGLACVFSLKVDSSVLRIIFASFIILIGVVLFFVNLFQNKKAYQKMYDSIFYPAISQFVKDETKKLYQLEFFTQGVVGIVNKWIEMDCVTEIEDVIQIIKNCVGYTIG